MLFGAHVSTAGGIDSGIDRIHDLGGTCVQVFTQSPRMWKPTAHKPESIARFKERRAECGIGDVVCHALYLVNLASPNDEFYDKSIVAMGASMDAAVAIEAEGVIFHVGSHMGAGFEAGLERVVPAMRQVLEQTTDRTWLLMENSAGAGGTIGRDLDELVAIWEALDRHPRLGICLDTCHLFVSGVDVGDPAVLQATLDDLDARMGLDRLRCLHVNDSKAPARHGARPSAAAAPAGRAGDARPRGQGRPRPGGDGALRPPPRARARAVRQRGRLSRRDARPTGR
jgi:deoxyribonuclease-4